MNIKIIRHQRCYQRTKTIIHFATIFNCFLTSNSWSVTSKTFERQFPRWNFEIKIFFVCSFNGWFLWSCNRHQLSCNLGFLIRNPENFSKTISGVKFWIFLHYYYLREWESYLNFLIFIAMQKLECLNVPDALNNTVPSRFHIFRFIKCILYNSEI